MTPGRRRSPSNEGAIGGAEYRRTRRTYRSRGHHRPRVLQLLATGGNGGAQESYTGLLLRLDRTRYDVELLSNIFGVTYETVAHRICNLSDPKRSGIPFHFLRSDIAGNISKRYSASGLRFRHLRQRSVMRLGTPRSGLSRHWQPRSTANAWASA